MPGDKKHHTEKFRRCVEGVMAKGQDQSLAYAICTTSLQKAGEPIFEAAEEMRTLHLLGATGVPRMEMYQDRPHLVVPVVALMEGVIHAVNATNAEFVPLSTLQKAAATWNSRPSVLYHPKKNGRQCSANSPEILEESGIGWIFNARVAGKKLLCEAWIDEAKAKKLHSEMYQRLLSGGTEEVSVGAYVVTDDKPGTYYGKQYSASWVEVVGDHLAFLPGGRGACSVEMGCGSHRAAMRMLSDAMELEEECPVHDLLRTLAPMIDKAQVGEKRKKKKDCLMCNGSGNLKGNPCEACDGSGNMKTLGGAGSGNFGHGGRPGQIGGSSSEGGSGRTRHGDSDKEVYDSVEEGMKKPLPSTMDEVRRRSESDLGYAEQIFLTAEKLGGNPKNHIEAKKIIETHPQGIETLNKNYREFVARGQSRLKEKIRTASISTSSPCSCHNKTISNGSAAASPQLKAAGCGCQHGGRTMEKSTRAELIAELVTDRYSGFRDGDEAILEAASDARLEEFRTASEAAKSAERSSQKLDTDLRNASARLKVAEERIKASEQPMTEAEFLLKAPESFRTLLENDKAREDTERAAFISVLKDCGAHSEDELKKMAIPELEKLARYAGARVPDFSGRGLPRNTQEQPNFAPPDPYAAGIKALQSKTVN